MTNAAIGWGKQTLKYVTRAMTSLPLSRKISIAVVALIVAMIGIATLGIAGMYGIARQYDQVLNQDVRLADTMRQLKVLRLEQELQREIFVAAAEVQDTVGIQEGADQFANSRKEINEQLRIAGQIMDAVTGSIKPASARLFGTRILIRNLGAEPEEIESLTAAIARGELDVSLANSGKSTGIFAHIVAISASDMATQGGVVVAEAIEAMRGINDASQRIANMIGVIDEIAFQRNLLALNAAVEAARAGEQGRGFAVVASEVRNLAQRSTDAAKEIKDLIEDTVRRVEQGSKLVNASGEMLRDIVTAVSKVNHIIAEIAAAGKEQALGIEQVNRAITQMDEMTQQNAALVEESASASAIRREIVHRMHERVSFFTQNKESIDC